MAGRCTRGTSTGDGQTCQLLLQKLQDGQEDLHRSLQRLKPRKKVCKITLWWDLKMRTFVYNLHVCTVWVCDVCLDTYIHVYTISISRGVGVVPISKWLMCGISMVGAVLFAVHDTFHCGEPVRISWALTHQWVNYSSTAVDNLCIDNTGTCIHL